MELSLIPTIRFMGPASGISYISRGQRGVTWINWLANDYLESKTTIVADPSPFSVMGKRISMIFIDHKAPL